MSTTNTGTDDINLAPENDDHDDVDVDVPTNDDDTGDMTGQGNVNVPAAPGGELTGPQISISGWSKTKFRNSLVPRARTPFQLRISSDDWRIWLKQTDGRMPRPTTTSPTHSGTRHENGCHP